jgi:serine-type D-Ala-D-Ala endopeptidase (penicillin-binding protein 7)
VKRRFFRRALLVAGAALALAMAPAPGPGGLAQAATKKAAKKHPVGHHGKAARKRKHVFLERHVVAIRGGMPNVQALGALVIDETGREIYARNADKERPIASISKLAATLAVADRQLELDGLSTIAKGDIDVAKGGARSRLLDGMTLSNRDLLHAALMGSDNRAIPALGRSVKLTPSQLTTAMNNKMHDLGLPNTRFHEPTGLSPNNVSTPRETIKLLRVAMAHPVLGPIIQRAEYEAHPVGKPSLKYINTDHVAQRSNIQVLGGKTGYNDVARYCLVIATRIDGHLYYMSFLSNEGKLTRFGDVARVADWLAIHKPKGGPAVAAATAAPALPVGVAAPPPVPEVAPSAASEAPAPPANEAPSATP